MPALPYSFAPGHFRPRSGSRGFEAIVIGLTMKHRHHLLERLYEAAATAERRDASDQWCCGRVVLAKTGNHPELAIFALNIRRIYVHPLLMASAIHRAPVIWPVLDSPRLKLPRSLGFKPGRRNDMPTSAGGAGNPAHGHLSVAYSAPVFPPRYLQTPRLRRTSTSASTAFFSASAFAISLTAISRHHIRSSPRRAGRLDVVSYRCVGSASGTDFRSDRLPQRHLSASTERSDCRSAA